MTSTNIVYRLPDSAAQQLLIDKFDEASGVLGVEYCRYQSDGGREIHRGDKLFKDALIQGIICLAFAALMGASIYELPQHLDSDITLLWTTGIIVGFALSAQSLVRMNALRKLDNIIATIEFFKQQGIDLEKEIT